MCNTAKLLEGAVLIAQLMGKEVTAIQFEDGTGYKFNYQLDNSGKWEFIDMSRQLLAGAYYHQLDMINEVKTFSVLKTTYNNLLIKKP